MGVAKRPGDRSFQVLIKDQFRKIVSVGESDGMEFTRWWQLAFNMLLFKAINSRLHSSDFPLSINLFH